MAALLDAGSAGDEYSRSEAMRQATLLWLRCAPHLTWERDVSVIGPQRLLQGPLAHRQSDELAPFKQLVQGGIDARAGRLDQHR